MRTFDDLRKAVPLHQWRDTDLGAAHLVVDATQIVWTGLDVEAYVALHKFAHLWIHRDYELDAWRVIDVDVPIEVGADFVVMAGRVGNALESFTRDEDRADAPPRFHELNALIPKLVATATDPVDQWMGRLIEKRISNPDFNTVYVWADQRFYIQDLAPSRAELTEWKRLPPSGWKECAMTGQVARDQIQERIERVAAAKATAPLDKETLDIARVKREARTGALGKMSPDELAIKLEDLYFVDHPSYRTNQELIDLINLLGQFD